MKRLITAAGVAGVAMLGPTPAEAAPADTTICADVYADTPQDVPAELSAIMGAYATNGISVHVQTLKNGGVEGIHGPDDTRGYAERLADKCDWDTENLVNVVVSDDPRTYAVYKSGNAATLITQSVTDAAEKTFRNDLRDTSNSYFFDAAKLLQTINPYKGSLPSAAHEAPTPAEAAPASTSEDEGSGLSLLWVGGGVLAVAAAGAGVLRTKRGLDIRRDSREGGDLASDVWSVVTSCVSKAELLAGALHKDDAMDLRQLTTAVAELNTQLDAERLAVLADYKEQKGRVWPDRQLMAAKFAALEDKAETVHEKAVELEAVTAEVEEFMVNIDAMIDTLGTQLSKVHQQANALTETGWNLGVYGVVLSSFDGQQTTVTNLRKEHYVERPGEMIQGIIPNLETLHANIVGLPDRRKSADQLHADQQQEQTRLKNLAEGSKRVLDVLRSQYDDSCYSDVNRVDVTLDTALHSLASLHEEGAAYKGVKSLTAVEKSDFLNQSYASLASLLETEAKRTHDRLAQLRTLQDELPGRVSDVDTKLSAAHIYAFETYAGDVEDDVRDQLTELSARLTKTKQELEAGKPAYLKVDRDMQSHATIVQRVTQLAHTQKQEMDTLRSDVVRLESQAESDRSSLVSYASNSDVSASVRTSARNLSIASSNTRDNRFGLQGQVANYKQIRSDIEAIRARARNEISAAEAVRERERQRIAAEQAAAAAALLASQQTYSAPSTPTTNDSGTF